MTDAFEIGLAYFSFVVFLAIVLQVMGGPRSRAGYWLFGIFILAPLFLILFAGAFLVDVAVGLWRSRQGDRFRWSWTRWLLTRLTGPKPGRPIRPSELRTLSQLMQLTPMEFEFAVGDLMRELGFRRVRRIGGAGDLAVDLTARDPDGRSVAVQCKRYDPAGSVGSPEIQKFIGMTTTHHRTDRAIFTTTARFTKPASDLAAKHRIELWDGAELARLLAAYRPKPEDGKGATEYGNLTRGEQRAAKRAARWPAEEARDRYEHASSFDLHVPDAALDLARESAAARALRRQHPDREASEEEIDALIEAGSPVQPPKRCDDCGEKQMQWYDQLPGHYCHRCERIELWIADERKVLSPRSKKRTRWTASR